MDRAYFIRSYIRIKMNEERSKTSKQMMMYSNNSKKTSEKMQERIDEASLIGYNTIQ